MDTEQNKTEENKVETEEVKELKLKYEEYLNGWKRAKADFINYQKDEARRFEEVIKFSNQNLIKDLLIVLDSLSLATVATANNKGVFLVKNQLEEILKKHGVEKIVVVIGQNFDPTLHEAVAEVDSSDQPHNTIAEVVENGYTLHGKVVRATKVKVVK